MFNITVKPTVDSLAETWINLGWNKIKLNSLAKLLMMFARVNNY